MDRLEYLSCPSSSLSKEGERRWAKQLDNLSYEKRRRRSRDIKSLQDPASPWLSSHTIAQDQPSPLHPVPSTPPLGSPPGSSKHLQTTRADRPEGRATTATSYLPTRTSWGHHNSCPLTSQHRTWHTVSVQWLFTDQNLGTGCRAALQPGVGWTCCVRRVILAVRHWGGGH